MRPLLAAFALLFIYVPPSFAEDAPLPSVIVHQVEASDLTPGFKLTGRVEARESVDLLARVSGFLEERAFTEGRSVEQGQVLFRIEKNSYEISLKEAQANLLSAQAVLQNARSNLSRIQTLSERKVASESQLDQARSESDQARAALLSAEAGLARAQLNLEYTEVKAPFTGRIGKSNFSVGDLIGPESGPLATLVKLDEVYVSMAVSVKLMLDARKQGIDLDNPPSAPSLILSDGSAYPYEGRFDYIAPEVDTRTDTLSLRAVFPNPDGLLLAGEFVNVEVRSKTAESGILIPQSAVQRDSGGYFVLRVADNNIVEMTRVELGRQLQGSWQVLAGLSPGDTIITQGLQKVRPGMPVDAIEE
ncbi:efflux RND transporter periplasmic adaptor subunit [Marinobacterium sp. YM272]|uniref:efflux RND transporter periplasmic adaptor subunit n=1 Tax=Marinobacterium sp. YM272 TaxID=3421654 RepID=UPI003D7F7C01